MLIVIRAQAVVLLPVVLTVWLGGCARLPASVGAETLREQVAATERAFAATMAARDHAAFTGFLADDAVFFSGADALRGKAAVAAAWKPFFEGPTAPFSWEPDQVEVLDSGTLALSTGPVFDPSGHVIARFNSIWRREGRGQWRVVFDKGNPVCPGVTGGASAAGGGGEAGQGVSRSC